jgi:hypothetical protein
MGRKPQVDREQSAMILGSTVMQTYQTTGYGSDTLGWAHSQSL